MKRIQIEPDELRNFSRMMVHNVNLMLDEEFKLRRAIACLDMDWQGGRSVEFMEEANTLQQRLHSRIDEFYELARRLNREADRWEESDQTWVQQYRDLWAAKAKRGG